MLENSITIALRKGISRFPGFLFWVFCIYFCDKRSKVEVKIYFAPLLPGDLLHGN